MKYLDFRLKTKLIYLGESDDSIRRLFNISRVYRSISSIVNGSTLINKIEKKDVLDHIKRIIISFAQREEDSDFGFRGIIEHHCRIKLNICPSVNYIEFFMTPSMLFSNFYNIGTGSYSSRRNPVIPEEIIPLSIYSISHEFIEDYIKKTYEISENI